jgi:hypothetical protein
LLCQTRWRLGIIKRWEAIKCEWEILDWIITFGVLYKSSRLWKQQSPLSWFLRSSDISPFQYNCAYRASYTIILLTIGRKHDLEFSSFCSCPAFPCCLDFSTPILPKLFLFSPPSLACTECVPIPAQRRRFPQLPSVPMATSLILLDSSFWDRHLLSAPGRRPGPLGSTCI